MNDYVKGEDCWTSRIAELEAELVRSQQLRDSYMEQILTLEAERDKLRAEVERHIFERERLKKQHEYVVKKLEADNAT